MKRKLIAALALLLVMGFASALADGLLLLQPLSLADKIKQSKERSYLSSENKPKIVRPSKTDATELPGVFEMAGGEAFTLGTVKRHDTYSIVNFKSDDPDQMDFARRYVDALVENYGYELSHEDIGKTKYSGYSSSVWYLEHPDSGVGSDEPYEEEGRKCDVFIRLNQYFDDGDCTLAIYHVDELSHPDAGNGNSSGSSGKSYCAYCNNGSCNYCGGSGWISTWSGTERVKQDCSMCIGGRCTRC